MLHDAAVTGCEYPLPAAAAAPKGKKVKSRQDYCLDSLLNDILSVSFLDVRAWLYRNRLVG